MKLGKVELVLHTKIKKDCFVIIKLGKRLLHQREHIACIALILSKKYEVHESVHHFDNA